MAHDMPMYIFKFFSSEAVKEFKLHFLIQEGNPFKPFWDGLEVDFDEKIVYHLGVHVWDRYERDQWQSQ